MIRIEEDLSEIHIRLAHVTIENLPWQEFIQRYDRPEVFFYLDPPYHKAPYYKHNMVLEDYQEMAEILAGVKGKFILSINDHPDMCETFERFSVRPVRLKYSASQKSWTEGKELLVSNFRG